MKTVLIAKETFTETLPPAEFRFENMYGQDCGQAIVIPARTVTTYKGDKFTARNKRELSEALKSGKWEIRV